MISQSRVQAQDGTYKTVKNLGWLLRNWEQVKNLRVYTQNLTNPGDDAYLVAELYDGRRYETGFADQTVLLRWLRRPIFYGLPLFIDGYEGAVKKL